MWAFIIRNPGTCFFLVVGAVMNIGSRLNDAYTFFNAGLPHQVYEAFGALVFFLSVAVLLFRWDKQRIAQTDAGPMVVPEPEPEPESEPEPRRSRHDEIVESQSLLSTAHFYSKADKERVAEAISAILDTVYQPGYAVISDTQEPVHRTGHGALGKAFCLLGKNAGSERLSECDEPTAK